MEAFCTFSFPHLCFLHGSPLAYQSSPLVVIHLGNRKKYIICFVFMFRYLTVDNFKCLNWFNTVRH